MIDIYVRPIMFTPYNTEINVHTYVPYITDKHKYLASSFVVCPKWPLLNVLFMNSPVGMALASVLIKICSYYNFLLLVNDK